MRTIKFVNTGASTSYSYSPAFLPRSHVIKFTSPSTNPTTWAFHWGRDDTTNPAQPSFYRFNLNSSFVATLNKTSGGATVSLSVTSVPEVTSTYGEYEVTFREIRLGLSNEEYYIAVSVFLNHRNIISYIEKVPPVTQKLGFGFGIPAGATCVFEDFYCGELAPIADWISIDPGEAPLSAMTRAAEGYYLKYHARYDGSFRAWRARAAKSSRTFTKADTWNYTRQDDYRELKTHVRQLGAYIQTEFVRPDLVRKYGHRFAEIQNPYLMNEAECAEQAEKAILRMEEVTQNENFDTLYRPELEREDRLLTIMGDSILTSYSAALDGTGGAQMSISTRKYTFGI